MEVQITKEDKFIIKNVERLIRLSPEYKSLIRFLKYNKDVELSKDAFFGNIDVSDKETKVRLEFHHEPFTLFDIVWAVILKLRHEGSDISDNEFMIADEVMKLHYEGKIGLIPLTTTLHELAHSGELEIKRTQILGDIETFFDEYCLFLGDYSKLKYKNLFTGENDINTILKIKNLNKNEVIDEA